MILSRGDQLKCAFCVRPGILASEKSYQPSLLSTLPVFPCRNGFRFAGDVKMAVPADSSSPSTSYIHLVQHLIEKCLLFNMDQQECAEALSKNANIQPAITVTVWNELEKENKEFFSRYMEKRKENRSQDLKQILDDINARFYKQTL